MRSLIIGVLFGFAFTLPMPAQSAVGVGYLVPLTSNWEELTKGDGHLKACGDYFSAIESAEKRIVHFIYEEMAPKHLAPVPAYATMDAVDISTDKRVETPMIIVVKNTQSTEFFIRMNAENYRASLPCIAKGEKV